ncbi:MAG: iron-containing alcohol dehydrogenase [Planctomycetota bacterium]|nr:iron-containing alcohol dehydrogenase [Planctomycetota bacterium]
MKPSFEEAAKLLRQWKEDSYVFGVEDSVYDHLGKAARKLGDKVLVVAADLGKDWIAGGLEKVQNSLAGCGVDYQVVLGAAPNAPRQDVYRIALAANMLQADVIVAYGGGSTIDAAKAAASLATFTPKEKIEFLGSSLPEASGIEPYFGADRITEIQNKSGRKITPIIAVQTAASSGAHLTKYANITDPVRGIKKLEIDYAHVPVAAVFDFRSTVSCPVALKIDGALDGIAHCWEVFMGATGKSYYDKICKITATAVELIVEALPIAVEDSENLDAHVALCLGTDLGGYAIMVENADPQTGTIQRGGTNGGHLGSFQLTDYLSHGRACALLNPYYTVLFANSIEPQCRTIGTIYRKHGYIKPSVNLDELSGRQLALVIARAMIGLSYKVKFPTSLKEANVPAERIAVMVEQSENPQLASKLQNMPVPMNIEKGDVRKYILPTLEAAYAGNLEAVPSA